MLIVDLIKNINSLFVDTKYTYAQIYPHLRKAINNINNSLGDIYRRIDPVPTVDQMKSDRNAYNEYKFIPDDYTAYLELYVACKLMEAEEDTNTSTYNTYRMEADQSLRALVAYLRSFLPVPPISTSIYFEESNKPKPVIHITNPSVTCAAGDLLPVLSVDNPYGTFAPVDPTQVLKDGTNDYKYQFTLRPICQNVYANVLVCVRITSFDSLNIPADPSNRNFMVVSEYIDDRLDKLKPLVNLPADISKSFTEAVEDLIGKQVVVTRNVLMLDEYKVADNATDYRFFGVNIHGIAENDEVSLYKIELLINGQIIPAIAVYSLDPSITSDLSSIGSTVNLVGIVHSTDTVIGNDSLECGLFASPNYRLIHAAMPIVEDNDSSALLVQTQCEPSSVPISIGVCGMYKFNNTDRSLMFDYLLEEAVGMLSSTPFNHVIPLLEVYHIPYSLNEDGNLVKMDGIDVSNLDFSAFKNLESSIYLRYGVITDVFPDIFYLTQSDLSASTTYSWNGTQWVYVNYADKEYVNSALLELKTSLSNRLDTVIDDLKDNNDTSKDEVPYINGGVF